MDSYLAGQTQFRNYDISPIVSALSLILTSFPRKMTVVLGRNRYFSRSTAQPPFALGGGIEAWQGVYTFMRPTYKQIMVNVDVHTAAFYTAGTLARAMSALQSASLATRANTFFRGVRIETNHLGHRKVIAANSTPPLTASTCSFDTSEYGQVTIEDYFRLSAPVLAGSRSVI